MRRMVFLTMIVLLILLTACQANADPAAENRLVIYSGRSESLVQPLIDRFQEETGIGVDVRYGDTAELAATILEEGDGSPADLFYAQDPGGLGAVDAAGLLAPLSQALLEQVPARFAAEDGSWIGVSGRARVVVYNTSLLSESDLPDDMTGFVDPRWDGRIGWAPTNGSFQAMVTGMRVIWGEGQTRAWLEGIQANHPVVYEKNTPIVAAVGAGEVEVGFVNHYYLYRFLAEEGDTFPARNYFLPGRGPGSLILVSGIGQLKTAVHQENARRFVEFLLTPESQQYFADETYEYPVVAGIAVNPLLPPLQSIDALAADIDLSDLADLPGTAKMLSELGILP